MLRSIYISNYALIDQTEVRLNEGFTVITGETGAGKSILLEALGLVLGSRANFNAIRKGEEKSVVEAVFAYKDHAIDTILRTEGLDVLDDLIIRRELTRSGRSRAFINDSPVGLTVLQAVALKLVDMHGQQENTALQASGYQLEQLDLFAQNKGSLQQYAECYGNYRAVSAQLEALRSEAAQVRKDKDYFSFQWEELSVLQIDGEELRKLEEERDALEHSEDISSALSDAVDGLDNEQYGALNAINSIQQRLAQIASFTKHLETLSERFTSVNIELDDLKREMDGLRSEFDANPIRLEEVRGRLDEYQRLMHKHDCQTAEELLQVQEDYRLKLDGIESFDEEAEKLEVRKNELREQIKVKAQELHDKRSKAILRFQEALTDQVRKLGMPKAELFFQLEEVELGSKGSDRLTISFDANGNKHLVSLRESASGGEVARIMLALKSILAAKDETPTLIFDEVDTGVSGEVAKQIGGLMRNIALNTQIIAVTHLPGVAAKGQAHIKIKKVEEQGQMVSRLFVLSEEERVEEIASMFSGAQLDEASLASARSLLSND